MKIRYGIATLLLLTASPAFAQFNLGNLLKKGVETVQKASEASKDISEADEIHLGDGISAMILGASPLYPDDELQRYVNRVGRWIALQSGRADLPWSFGVIDTPTVNAFSVPGGQVFVSIGMLRKLKSESELAGVLAHEVAHVALKHQVMAIQSAKSSGVWTAAGQDLAREKIAASRAGANPLTGALANAVAEEGIEFVKNGLYARPLDRSLEYDADRLGVVLAARAGYDSYGLMAALQVLATMTPEESSGSLSMSTHPSPNERLGELEKYTNTLDKYATQPQVTERFVKVMTAVK